MSSGNETTEGSWVGASRRMTWRDSIAVRGCRALKKKSTIQYRSGPQVRTFRRSGPRAHSAHIEPLAHGLEPECALDSLACRIFFRRTGVHFGGKCFKGRSRPLCGLSVRRQRSDVLERSEEHT